MTYLLMRVLSGALWANYIALFIGSFVGNGLIELLVEAVTFLEAVGGPHGHAPLHGALAGVASSPLGGAAGGARRASSRIGNK